MRDYYDPKFLAGVIRKTPPLRTFFRNRFFKNTITFPTQTVSFEFFEAERRLAPFVNERIGSETIGRDGYEVKTYEPPLIAPNRVITNDTLAQKLLGEAVWNSGITPEERAMKIAAQDIIDLQDTITRREEYMCARVKQDGKLDITGTGLNAVVDYGFTNIIHVAAADRWTTSSDIVEQLGNIAWDMSKDGVNADLLILGRDAGNMLLKNEKFLKLLDNRRVEMGEIKPSELEDGVSYLGRLIVPGAAFELVMYNEHYKDEKGKLKPLVDPETVIIQSSREQNSMLYGAVTFLNNNEFVTSMAEYTPRTWCENNPSQKFIEIRSKPLPMPHDLNAWRVLKGVVTGAE